MLKSVETYKNRQNYLQCYLSFTSFSDTLRSSTLPKHSHYHNPYHYLVKMRFSSLVTALSLAAIAQCYVASEATTADKNGCITVEQIQSAHDGLLYLSQQYDFPFTGEFPDPKNFRGKESKECVLESVSHAAADAMVKASKEYDFESKYADLMGRSPALLFKRARTCPEIQDDAEKRAASTWSCRSAPHFGKCKSCTGLTTVGFISGMGVCFTKKLEEAVPCCVLAATVYLGTYANVCLNK